MFLTFLKSNKMSSCDKVSESFPMILDSRTINLSLTFLKIILLEFFTSSINLQNLTKMTRICLPRLKKITPKINS